MRFYIIFTLIFVSYLFSTTCFSQEIKSEKYFTIAGQITHSCKPIVGASIYIKGATMGTSTDLDGRYFLKIPVHLQNNISFVFSHTGLKDRIIYMEKLTQNKVIHIALEEKPEILEELVIPCQKVKKQKVSKHSTILLKGQVYSSDSCLSVSNVKVMMYNDTTFTNEDGIFTFNISNAEKKEVQLQFQHTAYKNKTISFSNYELYQNQKIHLESLKNEKTFGGLKIEKHSKLELNSEKDENSKKEVEIVWVPVERISTPKNGIKSFYKDIHTLIVPPTKLKKAGFVLIKFTVNKNGELKDISILKSFNSYCDKQVEEAIKSVDNWLPAKQRGKSISQTFILPVFFRKAI